MNWLHPPLGRLYRPALLLVLLAGASCYSYRPVPSEGKEVGPDFRPKQVVVVHRDGHETTFSDGRIEGNQFVGRRVEKGQGIGSFSDRVEARVPLDEISFFRVRHFDGTKGYEILAGVAGGALVLGALASAISCPHVYSTAEDGLLLDAEPLSGTITRTNQRTDYQVLEHARPVDGVYRLLCANESPEIQSTDELKLLVADAEPGVRVIPDTRGGLLTVHTWEPPAAIRTGRGVDLTQRMSPEGDLFWEGDPEAGYMEGERPREELLLTFRRPPNAARARLLLAGGNTLWGMRVTEELLLRFAGLANWRMETLEGDPAAGARIERFLRENGAWIEAQVSTREGWATVGFIREAGFLVTTTQGLDFVLPPPSGETLQLRLRWAPLFWNVTKLGLEFDPVAGGATLTEVEASRAEDREQGDIRALLTGADGVFYQTERGAEATLEFPSPPPLPGRERTVLLKASGYYRIVPPSGKGSSLLASLGFALRRPEMDSYSLEAYRAARARQAGR